MKHLVDMTIEERKIHMRKIGTERARTKQLNKLKKKMELKGYERV